MKVFVFTEEEYNAILADVAQLRTEFETLRLQVLPDATPVAEEEIPPLISAIENATTEEANKVVPIAAHAHNSVAYDATKNVPAPESVVEFSAEEQETARVREAQRQVEEADAAHLKMNTKDIPQ